MQLAAGLECDADNYRWRVQVVDNSLEGLFKLRTTVEQTFPGVLVSRVVTMEGGLCFALGGYRDKHKLFALDLDEFNRLVGVFDPVGKVAEAGPFEVQAMLSFQPTQDFCDQLCELMRQGISRVRVSQLHDRLLSITVDDLNGDSDFALTVKDVDDELKRLLCCGRV